MKITARECANYNLSEKKRERSVKSLDWKAKKASSVIVSLHTRLPVRYGLCAEDTHTQACGCVRNRTLGRMKVTPFAYLHNGVVRL